MKSMDEWCSGFAGNEIENFVATKDELFQLAKYWAEKAIGYEFFDFLTQSFSGDQDCAWHRVSKIADLLGEEESQKAVNEAYEECGEVFHRQAWDVFMKGNKEERKAFQEWLSKAEKRESEEVMRLRSRMNPNENSSDLIWKRLSTEESSADGHPDKS